MRILIADDYQDAVRHLRCFQRLHGHHVEVATALHRDDDAAFAAQAADAEALVLIRERTRVDAALLERMPRLRLISQTGRVGNHIDLAACSARGVAVAEGVGSPVAPAELAWTLILAASRRLPAYTAALQGGRWQATGDAQLGRTLCGLTLGIWSYGKIGQRVAGYARAFGMRVQVWGGDASCAQARADGFEIATDRAALFAGSDVLSLHRRLVDATRHAITGHDLLRMTTRCCAIRGCWRPRTWAMSNSPATNAISARHSTTSSPSPPARRSTWPLRRRGNRETGRALLRTA